MLATPFECPRKWVLAVLSALATTYLVCDSADRVITRSSSPRGFAANFGYLSAIWLFGRCIFWTLTLRKTGGLHHTQWPDALFASVYWLPTAVQVRSESLIDRPLSARLSSIARSRRDQPCLDLFRVTAPALSHLLPYPPLSASRSSSSHCSTPKCSSPWKTEPSTAA